MIKISDGNSKMGVVPSFSLPAGVTCSPEACRTCYKDGCYARKIEQLRPTVHNCYMRNLQLCKENLQFVEQYFMCYFGGLNAPRVFRLHVSGDFFSAEYFEMWLRVIAANPGTRFLAFTKQIEIIRPYLHKLPKNFSLVWSAWTGVPIPPDVIGVLPVAWMDDGKEDRIPCDAIACAGNCESCGKCWALNGRDVVFHKH